MSMWPRIGVLLLGSMSLAACGDSAEAREARDKTKGAVDATGALIVKTWEDLETKARPRLEELRGELAKLRSEVARRGEQAKSATAQAISDVERQLDRAGEQLEAGTTEAGKTIESVWSDIEREFESAGRSIEEAWQKLTTKG